MPKTGLPADVRREGLKRPNCENSNISKDREQKHYQKHEKGTPPRELQEGSGASRLARERSEGVPKRSRASRLARERSGGGPGTLWFYRGAQIQVPENNIFQCFPDLQF